MEPILGDSPVFIEYNDECFYAREYISRGGYKALDLLLAL